MVLLGPGLETLCTDPVRPVAMQPVPEHVSCHFWSARATTVRGANESIPGSRLTATDALVVDAQTDGALVAGSGLRPTLMMVLELRRSQEGKHDKGVIRHDSIVVPAADGGIA